MRRRRREEELERDIAEHIALETEELMARGLSADEARFAALRKFGNVALTKEDTRREWGWAGLDTWRADVRHAFRRIGRSPGTAALAVLSLALAFAPSVTVFSIMDRLFLTPIPIKAPGEIYEIRFEDTRPNATYHVQSPSYSEYGDLARALHSFSGVTYSSGGGVSVVTPGGHCFDWISIVSDNYFQVLGVAIPMGPGFLKDRPSLVIGHDFWMRELGGRPDALGQTLLVDGAAFTITGVAGPGFRGANYVFTPDLWVTVEQWVDAVPHFRGE